MKTFQEIKKEIESGEALQYVYDNMTQELYIAKYADDYDAAEGDIEAAFNDEFHSKIINSNNILELAELHCRNCEAAAK